MDGSNDLASGPRIVCRVCSGSHSYCQASDHNAVSSWLIEVLELLRITPSIEDYGMIKSSRARVMLLLCSRSMQAETIPNLKQ
ncbi:hypothetical protein TorRG33x02_104020 [Trema orientale]|uniref:Uncharacterized protein n=1 Tax=Trema orientale TaxID=63057 RepID=A0A2P5F7G7_TREOI|nr:hypothetical protein TorRG33x02_104020 [Trema orientale]